MTKPRLDDLEAVRKVTDALTDFDPADQERILRWARERVGLALDTAPAAPRPPIATVPDPATAPSRAATDIKSFVAEKKPRSGTQFAATVAYYYRFDAPESERKDSISADDLVEACRLVSRARPKAPGQTLVDASTQGLLDRRGRGSYAINTVGENLVAMALPSDAERAAPKQPKRKPSVKQSKSGGKPAKKAVSK